MAHKVIALWGFDEPLYEGKVKQGDELSLNDERYRELRSRRLVQDSAVYKKREAAVAKELEVAEKIKARKTTKATPVKEDK